MTRRELERLVTVWRRRLGLDRWAIAVEWREPEAGGEHGARASTWRSNDYDEARIRFSPSALETATDRELAVLVVHELLHCLTRDVEHVVELIGELELAGDARRLLEESHRHHVEQAVDRLAYRLVELVDELA